MNENHNSHFFDGFLLGIVAGALGVFLFGTKSGKNLVKILSDQGLDGLKDLIDEYSEELMEEDFEDESPEVVEEIKKKESKEKTKEVLDNSNSEIPNGVKEATPKKRFFKRFRK